MVHWQPDPIHQAFMKKTLDKAADHFNVTLVGQPVFGWRERTIGSKVISKQGPRWLRVVSEMIQWAQGDWWEGNVAAGEIKGVARPRVLDTYEWEEKELRLRAELMTFVEGRICSPTRELRSKLDLPDDWWLQLRKSLDALSAWKTDRISVEQETIARRFLVFYGDDIDPTITEWTTAHGDLHWSNLVAPQLSILDWEAWGRAPVGLDAATLYCYSLLVPEMAERVYNTFADILDTPDGMRTQLYVITHLLRRVDKGDYPDLAGPLHRHARKLLTRLRRDI